MTLAAQQKEQRHNQKIQKVRSPSENPALLLCSVTATPLSLVAKPLSNYIRQCIFVQGLASLHVSKALYRWPGKPRAQTQEFSDKWSALRRNPSFCEVWRRP